MSKMNPEIVTILNGLKINEQTRNIIKEVLGYEIQNNEGGGSSADVQSQIIKIVNNLELNDDAVTKELMAQK